MENELRYLVKGIEAREEGEGRTLVGMPITYNKDSQPIYGMFIERVLPGAVRSLGDGSDVFCLAHHDGKMVLGRRAAGTLKLEDSPEGVRATVALPDTSLGNDIWKSVKRGDLDGMSFRFEAIKDRWTRDYKDKLPLRELEEIAIDEVSIVTWPAYPSSTVSARCRETVDRLERDWRAEADARARRIRLALAR